MGLGPGSIGGASENAEQLQERRDEGMVEIHQHHHRVTRPAGVFLVGTRSRRIAPHTV